MKNKFLSMIILLSLFFPINSLHAQTNSKEFKKVFGRWLRPDGGYVLVINDVDKEGNLDAAYLNPKSINVSQAHATIEENQIKVFVELKDRYYPGSYYVLIYNTETDNLIGVYHHLGINQKFDVEFIRQEIAKEEQ
jgi:hypothetical protein